MKRVRRAAGARSHAQRLYADYREMLQKEKPDFVAICSRAPEHRLEMVTAAVEAARHMLIEKPLAKDLTSADAIVRMTEERGLHVGHGIRHKYASGRTARAGNGCGG